MPLGPQCKNVGGEPTPAAWAKGIAGVANDCYAEMVNRDGEDDPSDHELEKRINAEFGKWHWKKRVYFEIPKEFKSRRWDEALNSHTFADKFVKAMGFQWPDRALVIPKYSDWLVDSILAAPTTEAWDPSKAMSLEDFL